MTIQQIYSKYHISKTLQQHMLRVATLGKYIAQNYTETVNIPLVTTVLLLHDMGNLIKFDLDRIDLFDPSEQNKDYWKAEQEQMIKKYGNNEFIATYQIAQEVTHNERVLFILKHMSYSNIKNVLESNDHELKICAYSDYRVGPHGFVSLEDRFADLAVRYQKFQETNPNIKEMNEAYFDLEDNIQNYTSINLDNLPYSELEAQTSLLCDFDIHHEQ